MSDESYLSPDASRDTLCLVLRRIEKQMGPIKNLSSRLGVSSVRTYCRAMLSSAGGNALIYGYAMLC